MKFITLVALVILLTLPTSTLKVDSNTSLFVDQYGRYAIYHGVNVVFKTYPFYPDLEHFNTNFSLTDHDLLNLKEWGMNVIRLHAAWEAIEPTPWSYNYTYIEILRTIVRKCNKFGIMVLLDAHQDLFAKQFCGEGLPTWVAKRQSFPAPLKIQMEFDKDGFPLRKDCLQVPFGSFYATYDVMKLQKDLFTNKRGLLDHLCKMWEILSAYMSSQPNIMGYEFINEPIGANLYSNPIDTLLPGYSNNKYLLEAYRKIYKSIRKNDQHNIIFFEPSTFDVFGAGFIETPGGQNELDKQVFSYHVYCPIVTKQGEPVYNKFCKGFDALTVASKEQNLKDLKIGGFMTEYGALSGSLKSALEITTLTDLMEIHFRSWTYWQFKYYNDITTAANPGTVESFYDENGTLQVNKVKALSRPYAYAICGHPIKQSFRKNILTLVWVPKTDCYHKNTELFLSEGFYYSTGIQIAFKNCKECIVRKLQGQTLNFYEVIIDAKSAGKKVTLTVSAKNQPAYQTQNDQI